MVSNSGCSCVRAMNFTRDLETEGHAMVYVTFVISACICPIAMNFLFRKVFRSENSFQLSPFVIFTSDLETEGHVMVYVNFVISACICLTAMIFLDSSGFQVKKFILTIANCVIFTCGLENWICHVMVYMTICFVRLLVRAIHYGHASGNS